METRQDSRHISVFSSATKWWIPVDQQRTDNREQMPQEEFQTLQKKIEIPQLAQEKMRSEIGRMMLEMTIEEQDALNQAVIRTVNGTARAWSIQYEI